MVRRSWSLLVSFGSGLLFGGMGVLLFLDFQQKDVLQTAVAPEVQVAPDNPLVHPAFVDVSTEVLYHSRDKHFPHVRVVSRPKGGRKSVDFPQCFYVVGHYDGWQECLLRHGHLGVDVRSDELGVVVYQMTEDSSLLGLESGFLRCREIIRALSETHSIDEVREFARSAYFPRNEAPWGFQEHSKLRSDFESGCSLRSVTGD